MSGTQIPSHVSYGNIKQVRNGTCIHNLILAVILKNVKINR